MKTIYYRIILSLLASAFIALISVGCATTKGFGEDVEKLGNAIQGE